MPIGACLDGGMTATNTKKGGPRVAAPATQTPMVRKYHSEYPCEVVKTTPTRHLVRFTQKGGKTVERWVPHADVTGYEAPARLAEVRPIGSGAKKAIAKAAAKKAPAAKAEPVRTAWHEAREASAAAHAAAGTKPKERRNETRHPDGRAAVDAFACPKCGAKKGDQCFKSGDAGQLGARTPFVHAPRFAKWEAKNAKG